MRATARSMSSSRRLLRQTRGLLRFRRQHAIRPFVADFYCPAAKLVIEVDGATHDHRQDADRDRDRFLAAIGLRVVRITAQEVLADPEAVADQLFRLCSDAAGPSTTQLR